MTTQILNKSQKPIAQLRFKSDEIVENKRNAKQCSEIEHFVKYRKAHYQNYKNVLHIVRYNLSENKPCLVIFYDNSKKVIMHYRYADLQKREERVASLIKAADNRIEIKANRKTRQKENRINLEVGDLLYSSWGYDQTNIDYYQVTKLIGKASCEICQIGKANLGNEGSHDRVKAVKDNFIGEPMTKRIGTYGVKIASYAHATPMSWDDTKTETNSYYGH
jgi:hypothetical protein